VRFRRLGEGDLDAFSGLGFSFFVSVGAGGAVATGFFSLSFPASRLRPAEREVDEDEDLDRELEPEELDELEEEEREPLEEALEEEPLLESLFPPRFFFFSAALESLAFVRSRLLRLDAIVIRKFPFLVYQRFAAILLKILSK